MKEMVGYIRKSDFKPFCEEEVEHIEWIGFSANKGSDSVPICSYALSSTLKFDVPHNGRQRVMDLERKKYVFFARGETEVVKDAELGKYVTAKDFERTFLSKRKFLVWHE